ncbi:MAG: T9SS type A sorting domain-containing protein [Bacteroidetes bacterium]|nr:T9SS type A sorting domain-containing protein [Bacteroidota bacterium]
MEAQELNSISLQPNPASTFFTLSNVVEGTTVNVMDVTGKVIVSSPVSDGDKTITIETSNLSNGVYMIQLKNNGAVAHKKLIISK